MDGTVRDIGRFLTLVGMGSGGGGRYGGGGDPAIFGVFAPGSSKRLAAAFCLPAPVAEELVTEWRRCLIKSWERLWAIRNRMPWHRESESSEE